MPDFEKAIIDDPIYGKGLSIKEIKEAKRKKELILKAELLNQTLGMIGASAYFNLDVIRSFPKPILVGAEHVLISGLSDHLGGANPDAHYLLEELDNIGTIFVITSSTHRRQIRQSLESNGLWKPGMILMDRGNWIPNAGYYVEAIDDFIVLKAKQGQKFAAEDFDPFFKRVAPIFHRPFDIPLIDDTPENTHANPGILGLQVTPFNPISRFDTATLERREMSFHGALYRVAKHYFAIQDNP